MQFFFFFGQFFLCKPLARNLLTVTKVISLLISISVQMWMFTLWTLAESQRRASQACAAASVHNLSSFSMLDISGEVRVLRPVRAAASGPLGKQQLEVRSNLLEATTMDGQHNHMWQSYFFFSSPEDNPTKIPFWGRSITPFKSPPALHPLFPPRTCKYSR